MKKQCSVARKSPYLILVEMIVLIPTLISFDIILGGFIAQALKEMSAIDSVVTILSIGSAMFIINGLGFMIIHDNYAKARGRKSQFSWDWDG